MRIYLVLDGTSYPIAAFRTMEKAKAYAEQTGALCRVLSINVRT